MVPESVELRRRPSDQIGTKSDRRQRKRQGGRRATSLLEPTLRQSRERCAQKTAAHLSHHAVVAAAGGNSLTCSRRRLAPDVSFTFLAAASHLPLASKLTKSCTHVGWNRRKYYPLKLLVSRHLVLFSSQIALCTADVGLQTISM